MPRHKTTQPRADQADGSKLESYPWGEERLAQSVGAANLKGNAPLDLSHEQNNANPIPRRVPGFVGR